MKAVGPFCQVSMPGEVKDLMHGNGKYRTAGQWNDLLMIDEVNDVRIIGAITIIALLGIALIGMEWETRAQLALLAILLIAIANFAIGTFLPPSESKEAQGFVGYQVDVFKSNWGPDFSMGEGFFSVFSIFFPAATGILAGANISGDLADAQSAIPKGTLLAILISMSTYVVMAWMAGACMLRSAPIGGSTDYAANMTMESGYVVAGVTTVAPSCVDTKSCPYGLLNDMQMMQLTSAFGPITVAGIISATLSSALASLISAPKVFQAVCKDKIFPGIHIFGRGYGKSEEPRLAYILAFGIGLACIGIGQLNAIAPLISNFFLMSYALINYSCFDASLAKSPGWRPAFRYYSMWMSLLGAVICLGVMFVISWYTALLTLGVVATLYTYVHYRKPDVNWGSSTQAHVYRSALQHTLKLTSVLEHVKNFRPQLLVMSGFPSDRPALVDIAANISKNVGLMVCGHVIQGNPQEKLINTKVLSSKAYTWIHARKVKSFYAGVTAQSLRAGAQSLLQGPGIGKLRPNTLLLGFKTNWLNAPQAQVVDYINIIHDAFDLRYGVGILRLAEGLHSPETNVFLPPDEGLLTYEEENGVPAEMEAELEDAAQEVDIMRQPSPCPNEDTFRKKLKGTIDVWWLFDDGGLTLLIPYLLTTNSIWQNCKLRVFAAGTKTMELDRDQRHMATLLSKFRIEYSSMTVVQDIGKRPDPDMYREFQSHLGNWMLDTEAGETEETHPWKISENELSTQKEKTFRNIRLRQLLKQHSSDAKLIVMTLPMPKKGLLSSGLYMAWLDTLSRDMPPILLLRGNQTSVLTYYS
ncbi:Solute carrier family 12 member 2 [Lamellibrachia satsuma]|nr:Solute carrier family 12 member 2 [Lamellibrachia satsuma]